MGCMWNDLIGHEPSVATVTFNGRESTPQNTSRFTICLRSACTQMGAPCDEIDVHAQRSDMEMDAEA